MKRIAIIGTSCSGKTLLARALSEKLGIPHIELDQLHWLRNWVERPDEEFRSLVTAAASEPNWVVDGNYDVVRDLIWPQANIIIWLNYSFPRVLFRALRRSLKRAVTKETVCAGNTESFRHSFFSSESVILWVIKTHNANRLKYRELLAMEQLSHCNIKVFANPAQLNSYLDGIHDKHC